MESSQRRPSWPKAEQMRLLKGLFVCTFLSGIAFADLTIEATSRASLVTGVGSAEVSAVSKYQGDKRTEAQTSKIVGGVVGLLAGKPRSQVIITRLDKGIGWELNPPQQTYSERPLALNRQPESLPERRRSGPAQGPPYKIVKSELKVTKTGDAREINGYACTHYLVTYELVLEDTASRGQITQLMSTSLWNTPLTDQLKQARQVEAEFARKLAEKVGVGSPEQAERLGLAMLTALYGLDPGEASPKLEQVAGELAKVEGYSILTEVKWQVKPDSTEPKREEPEPAPSGLGGILANKLAKKVAPSRPEQPGLLFSSYQEVKSVSLETVSEQEFEVPPGYKRVEPKRQP